MMSPSWILSSVPEEEFWFRRLGVLVVHRNSERLLVALCCFIYVLGGLDLALLQDGTSKRLEIDKNLDPCRDLRNLRTIKVFR